MPRRPVALTALILNRPFCIECILEKVTMTRDELDALLATIGDVLPLHRSASDPCRGCGKIGATVSLDGPLD